MLQVRFERNTLWAEPSRMLDEVTLQREVREMRAAYLREAFRALRSRIAAAIGEARLRLRTWQLRQAAMRELMGLDERMLRDIGLSRSEIGGAVVSGRGSDGIAANENRGPAANSNVA